MDLTPIIVIGLVAVALLFLDRRYRILPFLEREGFGLYSGGLQRCGVDLPPCPRERRCMNGLCRSTEQPEMLERNPLPVLP